MLYLLHANTLDVLARMKPVGHSLIFPWPYSEGQFYARYNAILIRAGLPHGAKDKTHKMRKSVASHPQARGVDACTGAWPLKPRRDRQALHRPANLCATASERRTLPARSASGGVAAGE